MKKIITKKMVEDGLMAKVIIPQLEDDGLKAYIGDNWFYFGGSEFEYTDPKDIDFFILVDEIKSALDSLDDVPEGNDGEYLYYYFYLCVWI